MKKVILFYFIFTIIFGCSSYKKEYDVTSTVLNKLVSPFYGSEIDSLDLVDYSFVIDTTFANSYKKIKKRKLSGFGCADCEDIVWKDSLNSWILSDKDIDFMTEEVNKRKKIKWNTSKFKTKIKSIKIVDYPRLASNFIIDKERVKRINNNRYMFSFCTPIFNKRKNIVIVSYSNVFLSAGETLIYKKIKNKWELVGEYY